MCIVKSTQGNASSVVFVSGQMNSNDWNLTFLTLKIECLGFSQTLPWSAGTAVSPGRVAWTGFELDHLLSPGEH